jgi:TRAP-type C4-dicarboxylate transport system substrate-binding protein
MKKTRILALLLALVLCFSLAACTSAPNGADTPPATDSGASTPATDTPDDSNNGDEPVGEDKPVTLSFSYFLGADSNFENYYADALAAEISEQTGGSVTLELYPGGTLAGPDETLNAVKTGVCDIGLTLPAYYSGEMPISFFVEYPLGWASAAACNHAVNEYIETLQPAELEGTVYLTTYNSGGDCIIASNDPINSLADLGGKEIRANAVTAEWLTAAGGTPVAMSSTEAYEALRSGVVSGFMGAAEALYNLKMIEITNYYYYLDSWTSAYLVLMNESKWESLSDNQRAGIQKACDNILNSDAACWLETCAGPTIDEILAKDATIVVPSEEENAKWIEYGEQIAYAYAEKVDERGLDGTASLELLLSLRDKYNAEYPDSINPAADKIG